MKVVLFCGGLGTRLREYSETVPKAMVNIGYRPIIWHLMKYYAHFGHTEFILCLGYRGDLIKRYFLDYDECMSNDFELFGGSMNVRIHSRDIARWTITFADTGLHSNIGQRLNAVRRYLGDDPVFLANYSDGLSDLPLAAYRNHGFWACMDTFKDKQAFDDMDARGDTPWQVWKSVSGGRSLQGQMGGQNARTAIDTDQNGKAKIFAKISGKRLLKTK